jgi:hypothetical protein
MITNRRLVERRLIENQITKLRERIRGNLDRSAHTPIRAELIVEIHKLEALGRP